MVTVLGHLVWSRRELSQHGQSVVELVVSLLVQQFKQTRLPHANSMGLSNMLAHREQESALLSETEGGEEVKKDGGAMAVSCETRSLAEFLFGLPDVPLFPPPTWRDVKC